MVSSSTSNCIIPIYPSLSSISTASLISQLNPVRSTKGPRSIFTNWATTFSCQTSSLFRPTTIHQVRLIVELSKRQGKGLRASGSGHSPSDLVCTKDFILNLDEMNKIIDVSLSLSLHAWYQRIYHTNGRHIPISLLRSRELSSRGEKNIIIYTSESS